MHVKAAIIKSRIGTGCTEYKTPIGTTKVVTASTVVRARETATSLEALMSLTFGSSDLADVS
jgi:hypothetical protein